MSEGMNPSIAIQSRLMRLRGLLACTASAGACILASHGTAFAQNAEVTSGVADIIVTAQKREQRLQDVPVAVTALGEDVLEANRVTNMMDLNGLAPGLSARENAGSNGSPSYTMRGVFASASIPAQDRQISSYVDGVYIGGTRGAIFDLPDLERIEVLRGPQGTLFGRNATAGAVSIVTRDPTGEFGIRQEVTLGNYDQLRTRTTINSPQMGILSAYVTYVHDERRGDTRNVGAGTQFDYTNPFNSLGVLTSPKWLGSKNSENIFVAVKVEPSDEFSLIYKFYNSDTDNTPEARANTVLNPADPSFGFILDRLISLQPAGGGQYGPVLFNPSNKRPKEVNNAFAMPGYVNNSLHSLTLNWRATDSLSFKSITAYRDAESLGITPIMGISGAEVTQAVHDDPILGLPTLYGLVPLGTYVTGYDGHNYGRNWQVSSELQANYDSDFLTLTVGGLWFHSFERGGGIAGRDGNIALRPLIGGKIPLGPVLKIVAKTTSIAAYGQAEFHVTPDFNIIAGARITKDKKENEITNGGTFDQATQNIVGEVVSPSTFKKTKPSFEIGANYKINPDVMVYGKFSTAFLSGGASGPLSFEPETVKSWEAGLKSDWFDNRLRFNLALYRATYKNSQSAQSGRNVFDENGNDYAAYGVIVISNGTVRATGVEVEVTAAPVTGLTLGGSFSYSDVKWLSPSPTLIGTEGRPWRVSGIPKVLANVNAQYVTPPLFGDANLLFRMDAIFQDKYPSGVFADLDVVAPALAPYDMTASRWIVNGRVALRDIDFGAVKGEIGLWARNLFDNKDADYNLIFGLAQHDASFQPARTVGVDLIANFGG